jgi:hypothetical protein
MNEVIARLPHNDPGPMTFESTPVMDIRITDLTHAHVATICIRRGHVEMGAESGYDITVEADADRLRQRFLAQARADAYGTAEVTTLVSDVFALAGRVEKLEQQVRAQGQYSTKGFSARELFKRLEKLEHAVRLLNAHTHGGPQASLGVLVPPQLTEENFASKPDSSPKSHVDTDSSK